MKIQKVELNYAYDISIFCPFCGRKVINQEFESGGDALSPCEHTLFIATDEGIDHRSERFDVALGIVGVESDEVEIPDTGFDGLTDKVEIKDAVKFASYVPAPGGMGAYVGFAPLLD